MSNRGTNKKLTVTSIKDVLALLLAVLALIGFLFDFFGISYWMRIAGAIIGILFICILIYKTVDCYVRKWKLSPKTPIAISIGFFLICLVFFVPVFFRSSVSCEIIDATREIVNEKADAFKTYSFYYVSDKEYKFPNCCIKTILKFKNRDRQPRTIEYMHLVANMTLGKAQNILASEAYIDSTSDQKFYNYPITLSPYEVLQKEIYFFFPVLPNKYNYIGDNKILPMLNAFKIVYQDSASGEGESPVFGRKEYSLKFKGKGLAQSTWMGNPNEPSTPEETQKKIEKFYNDCKKNPKWFLEKQKENEPVSTNDLNSEPNVIN
jgi:hypothetical protein